MTTEKTPGGIGCLAPDLVRLAASLKLTIVLLTLLAAELGWALSWKRPKASSPPSGMSTAMDGSSGCWGAWRRTLPRRRCSAAGEQGGSPSRSADLPRAGRFPADLAPRNRRSPLPRAGQTADTVFVSDRSNLTLLSAKGEDTQSIELGFSPDRPTRRSNQPLDFGEVDGMRVRVLQFYRHARYGTDRVADENGQGIPAIRCVFRLARRRGLRGMDYACPFR